MIPAAILITSLLGIPQETDVRAWRPADGVVVLVFEDAPDKPPEASSDDRPAPLLAWSRDSRVAVFRVPPKAGSVRLTGRPPIDMARVAPPTLRAELAGARLESPRADLLRVHNSSSFGIVVISFEGDTPRAEIVDPGRRRDIPVSPGAAILLMRTDGQATRWTAPPPTPSSREAFVRFEVRPFGEFRLTALHSGLEAFQPRSYGGKAECSTRINNPIMGDFTLDHIEYDADAIGFWVRADLGWFDVTARYLRGDGDGRGDATIVQMVPVFRGESTFDIEWEAGGLAIGRTLGGLAGPGWSVGARLEFGVLRVREEIDDLEVQGNPIDCRERETSNVLSAEVSVDARVALGGGWGLSGQAGWQWHFDRGDGASFALAVSREF